MQAACDPLQRVQGHAHLWPNNSTPGRDRLRPRRALWARAGLGRAQQGQHTPRLHAGWPMRGLPSRVPDIIKFCNIPRHSPGNSGSSLTVRSRRSPRSALYRPLVRHTKLDAHHGLLAGHPGVSDLRGAGVWGGALQRQAAQRQAVSPGVHGWLSGATELHGKLPCRLTRCWQGAPAVGSKSSSMLLNIWLYPPPSHVSRLNHTLVATTVLCCWLM